MVKINDKYYIDATNTCYILKEKVVVSDENSKNYGEVIYKDLGYYYSIENVITALLKKETRKFVGQATEQTLNDLIDVIQYQTDYIKSLNLKI